MLYFRDTFSIFVALFSFAMTRSTPPLYGTSRRLQAFDMLRFPLAIVVLLEHVWAVEGLRLQGEAIDLQRFPLFREVIYWIDAFLRNQSVPIYFFISGYVFFLSVDWSRTTYFHKLRNRVKTLLVPYVVWNAFALGLLVGGQLFLHWSGRASGADFQFSFSALLSCFWDYTNGFFPALQHSLSGGWLQPAYPLDVPLWFLRDLMIVVVCTPLLYWVLKRLGAWAVGGLGVLWLVLGYLNAGHIYQLVTAFFFFGWGACMSMGKKELRVEFGRYFTLSMWAYPLLGLLGVVAIHGWPEAAFIFKRLNILVGLLFAYNAATWLSEHGCCKSQTKLAALSFFIYVAHYPICDRVRQLLLAVLRPESDLVLLAVYVSTTVLTIGLLLGVFYLMRRYTPKVLTVLAGRA